jgi:hypothetical protein
MRLGRWVGMLALGAALACGGNLDATPKPPPSPDWVGTWTGTNGSDTILLTIGVDGMVHYQRSGTTQTQMDLPAQDWRDDGFDIGLSVMSTTFHVKEKPQDDGGVWKMSVEGFDLTKEAEAPVPEPAPADDEPAVTAP